MVVKKETVIYMCCLTYLVSLPKPRRTFLKIEMMQKNYAESYSFAGLQAYLQNEKSRNYWLPLIKLNRVYQCNSLLFSQAYHSIMFKWVKDQSLR